MNDDKTIQNTAKQANTTQSNTLVYNIIHKYDKARQDNTTRYEIRQDKTTQCNTIQAKIIQS